MVSRKFLGIVGGILAAAGVATEAVNYASTRKESMRIVETADISDALSNRKSALYFSTVWCQPCKQFLPIVGDVAFKDYLENRPTLGMAGIDWNYVDITKLNTKDANDPAVQQLKRLGVVQENGAYSVPAIVFLQNGNKVGELKGTATKKELENKIKEIYR